MRKEESMMTRIVAKGRVSQSKLFWLTFWLTILFLAVVYTVAHIGANKIVVYNNRRIAMMPKAVWDKAVPETITAMKAEFSQGLNDLEKVVDEEIDQAFEAVYCQIPKLADFHYSVTGEYSEVMLILAGKIGEAMRSTLFEAVQFDERLRASVGSIEGRSRTVVSGTLAKARGMLRDKLELTETDMGTLQPVLLLTLNDVEARFSGSLIAMRAVGAATGTSILIAKVMGKKVAQKVALKMGGKYAAKGLGAAAGAATGAALGSLLPVVGTAIGGAVGAVIFWFATDKVIVEIDEYFHRDQFVAEVRTMVDEEKEALKATLMKQLKDLFAGIVARNEKGLKDVVLKECIENRC